MSLPWLTIFGFVLTALAAITSAGMLLVPRLWQGLETWAYGGDGRPRTLWALAVLLLVLWGLGAAEFAMRPAASRNWAGWALAAGVPALWAVKSAALVFNEKGRAAVSSITAERTWRRIGWARLPIALVLALLTWLV